MTRAIGGVGVMIITSLAERFKLMLHQETRNRKKAGATKAAMGATFSPGAGGPPRTDSTDGASLFTALQRLGLKLEQRRAPADFLIVDRAEKVPVEN